MFTGEDAGLNSPILHHFDISPFAEKARLVFGLKAIAWRSVQIPLIMPKPMLTGLTGGYRKTPVMQMGANIYCDTRRIALELERRYPQPSLFPGGDVGLGMALSHWSDTAFFEPGAGLSMGVNTELPEPLLKDRKAFFEFMNFDRLGDEIEHLYTQLRAQASLVDRQLADARCFVNGQHPGWADICAYFPLWMARANVAPSGQVLARFTHLPDWEARIAALGHGERRDIEAAQAWEEAAQAEPDIAVRVDDDDPLGFVAGQSVSVAADDYGRDPVHGRLVVLDVDEVAVMREVPELGRIAVHFPRSGYRVTAL